MLGWNALSAVLQIRNVHCRNLLRDSDIGILLEFGRGRIELIKVADNETQTSNLFKQSDLVTFSILKRKK
jgi:predicted nucleotidyltransferase